MIQVEDEKMIFLDANAFYSYYGRSKLGMTSEPVDEERLKKYLEQQREKSLPTSVYIEIMTHFRNNPKVLQNLLEFRYAKGLPLFNNIPDYVVSEDEITSVAYMDQAALKNYADRLLKSKIQIESKFTLLFFEITKDLYAHYKLEMTDGLSQKNKDAILGYIGRVAYKEYQNLLEERIKVELQSGYDENKEKKVLKDFYIQELNEACVLTNIIIQGCVACKQDNAIGNPPSAFFTSRQLSSLYLSKLWESYSSFANSNGGVIILGVGERQDGTWYTTGLKNADKLKRNFWNTIHDTKKVSINLLSDKNVESYEVNGDTILVIYVPRAKREQKPVYINNDLFGGCYRRDWEGDYHCSKAEIKGMLRDAADETEDMKIVEQFDISAIDTESLKGFRNHHKSYRPEHVFNNLSDDEYLERIGAAGFGEDGKLHPTTAGLLMFGEEYHIVREFPEYFLDYREMLDPTIRWTDRLQSSSGDWSGNVFDFFFRVNSKIAKDIKKPFKLEGITRVDDTPVHKAVREALVNCLVNTDYFLPCGVVIKKEDDKLVIENPGSIRTGKKQMLRGGISDPRNKTLMKMFNMIGIGERAGSGIPDIYQVWENEGWPMPVVEESYNPDRTRLSLEFAKKQTIKTSEEEKEPKRSQKGAEKEPIKGAERKKEILKLIKVNSTITQVEIMKELDLTRKQVQKDMKELQEMHIIAREGTNRRGRWIIVKENK